MKGREVSGEYNGERKVIKSSQLVSKRCRMQLCIGKGVRRHSLPSYENVYYLYCLHYTTVILTFEGP